MAGFALAGDTSGQLVVNAPAVAGTNTLTLQAATGTAALTSDVIGIDQTWQNVTASRALATTYTNTTGKPIFVGINWAFSTQGGAGCNFVVSGVTVVTMRNNASASGNFPLFAIVPPSATYSLAVASSGSISTWLELR